MPDYYTTHPHIYHTQTFHLDPAPFLSPLTAVITPPATLLDVGCGSGRDLRWFQQRGYIPLGLERSPGLAALARQHSGCEVLEADFEQFDFSTLRMDALVLIGALVHIPPARTPALLGRIIKALKPGGFILISMKAGRGSHQAADGRIFHLWPDHALRHLFDVLQLTVREYFVSASALKTAETWHGYVLEKNVT